VADVVERLMAALRPDDTVIGGGNVKTLDALPRRCRAGENANAFRGGFRLWAGTDVLPSKSAARTGSLQRKNVRLGT
jgi:polyphosphate glucokinase